ncbi:MAG: glycoside hydrolase family 15 protein, partial [Catalinimonas sp.]
QLDIYGELMDAVYLYNKYGEAISYDFWLSLKRHINWLAEHWHQPDEGIWEVRGGRRYFLYSRLLCWVAMDRAIKLADMRPFPIPDRWRRVRDEIFESMWTDFWDDERQCFVQYKGSKHVDAATLLMPLVRFISAKDPRWKSTLRAIEEELVSDSLVFRYRPGLAADDGLAGEEGTFSMCSFWYVECLSRGGELEKARLYLEKMLGYANHVGLYAEMLGFRGEHLGNFPQAFTHLGLISAALNLDKQLNDQRNQEVKTAV